MRCASCNVDNSRTAIKCAKCGAVLSRRSKRRGIAEESDTPFGGPVEPANRSAIWAYRIAVSPEKECRTLAIYGGQRFGTQLSALKRGVSIVVGTPGRVIDHLSRGTLSLAGVHYLVLDEADRMLDIGFRPDIEKILRRCPQQRQTLLLSATLPAPVLRLAQRYMVDPLNINLSPGFRVTVENIKQSYVTVDEDRKFDLLLRILHHDEPRQCIIFCGAAVPLGRGSVSPSPDGMRWRGHDARGSGRNRRATASCRASATGKSLPRGDRCGRPRNWT